MTYPIQPVLDLPRAQLVRQEIQLLVKDIEIANLKIGGLLHQLRVAQGVSEQATFDPAAVSFTEPAPPSEN